MALPGFAVSALGFLGKYWHLIVIAMLLGACYHLNSRAVHWHDQTEICQTQRVADKKAYEAAATKAKNDNLETVRKVEQKWQGVVNDTEDKLNAQLDTARAAAADYARRMRSAIAASAGGNSSGSGVPDPAGASGATSGTGGTSLIPVPEDDLRVCAVNTVKAEGWQTFYQNVQRTYEEAIKPPE